MPLLLFFVALGVALWWAFRGPATPVRRPSPDAGDAAATPGRVRTRAEALRVLDLPETATAEEVEARYRTLRRTTHPDNFPRGKYPPAFVKLAEAEFKRLGEARDVLLGRR